MTPISCDVRAKSEAKSSWQGPAQTGLGRTPIVSSQGQEGGRELRAGGRNRVGGRPPCLRRWGAPYPTQANRTAEGTIPKTTKDWEEGLGP